MNGEARDFSLEGIRWAEIDLDGLAARGGEVLVIAREIAKRDRVSAPDFTRRLIVRGADRGEPQPNPLPRLLFELDGRFVAEGTSTWWSGLIPVLERVFVDRIRAAQKAGDTLPDYLYRHGIIEGAAPRPGRIAALEEEAEKGS